MDTISTGFIRLYGTTGPVFSSATHPRTLGTKWKRQVENAGIEPATTVGVLTTKPFPWDHDSRYWGQPVKFRVIINMTAKKYRCIRQNTHGTMPKNIKGTTKAFTVHHNQIHSLKWVLDDELLGVQAVVLAKVPIQEELFLQRQVFLEKALST